jgi:O-antigen/teichoic acid export membrane protein
MEQSAAAPVNRSLRAILALSGQSVAYGVGAIGSQLISLLLVPLLTHSMPADEYGAVAVMMTLCVLLNAFTNGGLPQATYRFYNDSAEVENRRVILGSSQLLFFLYAAIPAAIIILFPKPISSGLLGSDAFARPLQLAGAFLVVDSMNIFGTVVLRVQVRPLTASIQSMILVACDTGFAVLFVLGYHMGVTGYWLGYLTGEIIALMFTIWFVRKAIVFDVAWQRVLGMMKFGLPLAPAALSMAALRLADRYFIGSLAGLQQVAIYDVGYRVGTAVVLVLGPFSAAWTPFAFSISERPEARRVYRDVLSYLAAGGTLLVLGLVAFRRELVALMAPSAYAGAANIVIWSAFSQILIAAYAVFSIGPMIRKRTGVLAWASVTAALLNVGLNLLLIPRLGILGAAIATLASYATLAIVSYLIARGLFPMEVDWGRAGKLALATAFVLLGMAASDQLTPHAWLQAGIRVGWLLAFPVLLFLLRFVKPAQLAGLWDTGRELALDRLRAWRE